MLRSVLGLPLVAFCLLGDVLARSATGDRVLVVLEPHSDKGDYSKFWASLTDRGFDLTFKKPNDDSVELVKFGEPQYDHLIMFAPSAKSFSPSLSPKTIIEAQYTHLNTLYLLSPFLSDRTRETMREYDLEFIEPNSVLLDAFSHPPSQPESIVVLPPNTCLVPTPILAETTLSGGPIVYPSGTVHTAGLNPFLIDVLHATKTAYVGEEQNLDADESAVEDTLGGKTSKGPLFSGKRAMLVSALQTRDNVRIGFVGSGQMFSDKYWGTSVESITGQLVETGNAAFAEDFTKWIFQERGVVKVISTAHHRQSENQPREQYTKKDDLVYSVTLAEYYTTDNQTAAWGPVHLEDLQLEFTMLDPHIRTALIEDTSVTPEMGTTYTAKFKAPDRHGVFKFMVEYFRPGLSCIVTTSMASVVPLRHDEHPRFIVGAWPFYTAPISISFAFLLFCGLWVMLGEDDKKGKKKAE
ncbi:oligosaccharyltransferase complex subunit beta [Tremella mesenterica]|uniref:Dolichyl-diphosphooligosaccharide--protein glycosyltransferase subunit WBP1 n=1 Tax=Tremella mesenterica TaxID=5217 RepID=A0A4Q1BKC7_TREME|nr:uncharacterized protein TREMEDRAFT_71740 [Tremella mesenterica DSM 1558]EIW68966.1 hypothetical protein TREMEDRAFT_71740 [Tremella mesenterica DSM 1558]RXK38090.1 oligosaccharyltransferase complex subunit beta [Tremella mesenterica]